VAQWPDRWPDVVPAIDSTLPRAGASTAKFLAFVAAIAVRGASRGLINIKSGRRWGTYTQVQFANVVGHCARVDDQVSGQRDKRADRRARQA
jgi:hypothetical protein